MERSKFLQKRLLFVEISAHQNSQRCCRLNIPASLQYLHRVFALVRQSGPEYSMFLHSQGQHTGNDNFQSLETNTTKNISLLGFQFVMMNCSIKNEKSRFYTDRDNRFCRSSLELLFQELHLTDTSFLCVCCVAIHLKPFF